MLSAATSATTPELKTHQLRSFPRERESRAACLLGPRFRGDEREVCKWATLIDDQLGQLHIAMLQRAGAGRFARADLVGADDHLRHARRAESGAWRDVHARRLCRLARL